MRKGRGGAFGASALVLFLAGGFLFYALTLDQMPQGKETLFHATFISANGLESGADVILSGVKVGCVHSIKLDVQNAVADVAFTVRGDFSLPVDTVVTIGALTMTGSNALQIMPGQSHVFLEPGAVITNAHPLLSLEQQISNYIFNAGNL